MTWSRRLGRLALLSVSLLLGAGGSARADLILNTPGGLNPGDQFRIAFVTVGTTKAVSASIDDYNTFVTNDAIAQAGGAGNQVLYDGAAVTWKVIGSTAAVSAITNIGTFGVPVYLASGSLIAATDGISGLFAGTATPLAHKLNEDLTGQTRGPFVWTGTMKNGNSDSGFELGQDNVSAGNTGYTTNGNWLNAQVQGNNGFNRLYGISQVLTVPNVGPPPGVPEPSTLLTAALGGLGLVARQLWRRYGQS